MHSDVAGSEAGRAVWVYKLNVPALCPVLLLLKIYPYRGFPGDAVVENLPANAGDMGSSPGLGRYHMPRSN